MTLTLASAADARYGKWLLNLVGSVKRKSDVFDRIVLYDLGLTPFQRRLATGIKGVELRSVPAFVPHWRQGRTWKTWIWANLETDVLVWLDAGVTVLRPLTDFFDGVRERGYFVVSQGVPNRESIPSDYYPLYDIPPALCDQVGVAAGILAFARSSPFFGDVIVPTYEDALLGRSLGFSPSEIQKFNHGLDAMDDVIVRDCPIFRHEQTLLNIHLYLSDPSPVVADLDRFAGFRSPHDDPEQVIWGHRRRGDFRFLWRVPYRLRVAVVGVPWGMCVFLRWRARELRWVLRPSVHRHLLRRLTGRLRLPR